MVSFRTWCFFFLIVLCTLSISRTARRPLSPLKMTHSLKYHIIIAVENGKGVFNNACNLFKQNPHHSTFLYWNYTTGHLELLDGKCQSVSNDTMIHIVGHGGHQIMSSKPTSTRLGGLTPKRLAHVINLLKFKEPLVGHISLVACKLHYHADGHKGFLKSFLMRLVTRYRIVTTVSAWTMEVAVDPKGRLLSRMNASSNWYMNYPGSLVVASIVDRRNQNVTRRFEAGYAPPKNKTFPQPPTGIKRDEIRKVSNVPKDWYKNCSCKDFMGTRRHAKKSKNAEYSRR